MVVIPLGSDGEPRLDLLVKKRRPYCPPTNNTRGKWDIPYHQWWLGLQRRLVLLRGNGMQT